LKRFFSPVSVAGTCGSRGVQIEAGDGVRALAGEGIEREERRDEGPEVYPVLGVTRYLIS
jgi:hypothetical protein